MKIAILSRNPNLHSTARLRAAAEARDHTVRVIDYLRCYMNITSHRPMVMYQGRALEAFDAVIPRIGASQTFYGAGRATSCGRCSSWRATGSGSRSPASPTPPRTSTACSRPSAVRRSS